MQTIFLEFMIIQNEREKASFIGCVERSNSEFEGLVDVSIRERRETQKKKKIKTFFSSS